MHEELLGYLLGALEPEEERELEARLEYDADLRRELEELRRLLQAGPGEGYEVIDPPADLARRTCSSIDAARRLPPPLVPQLAPVETAGRWNRFDAFTLVGLAAMLVVLATPLISASRQRAQIAACRERMHTVGRALIEYTRTHGGYFPQIPQQGPQSHAGIYAVLLREAGLLSDTTAVYCPAHFQDEEAPAPLPRLNELHTADAAQGEADFAALEGLYGYTLGYVEDGRYHTPRNQDRAHYAILADAPPAEDCRGPGHGCGRNVWFEDGHAEFLRSCRLHVGDDAIYENRHGYVGAGIGPDDVVIGSGIAIPRILPVGYVR